MTAVAPKSRARRPRRAAKAAHPWTVWLEKNRLPPIPGYCPIRAAGPAIGDYYFDEGAATNIIDFFKDCIHHVKGPLARQTYRLEPWERTIMGCALGWKRESDRLRRYRKVFEYEPKKNGKTTRTAALVYYFTGCDGEYGAEVYSIAITKDQAAIVFKTAVEMRKLDDFLTNHFVVYGASGGSQQKSIICEAMGGSSYRPLAYDDDAADGLNIHAAIIDELHRHDSGAMLDIIERGTSSRTQPMIWIITTAAFAGESVCNRELAMAKLVRDNGGDPAKPGYLPHVLPIIYEASKADDYTDEAVWRRVNPGLGTSKSLEHMRNECAKAKMDPVTRNNFLRFELNVQTEQLESLIDMERWDKCPSQLNRESLRGRSCYLGVDLGEKDDLASVACLFPPADKVTGIWDLLWLTYSSEATIRRRQAEAVPYSVWRDEGWLIETPGDEVDFDWIERDIANLGKEFRVVAVGYDPRLATQLRQNLYNKYGMAVEPIRQGHEELSEATRDFKSLVVTLRLNHGGNKLARWCAANAIGEKNLSGHERPVKGKSKDKIDPIVAAIMGKRVEMKVGSVSGPLIFTKA